MTTDRASETVRVLRSGSDDTHRLSLDDVGSALETLLVALR